MGRKYYSAKRRYKMSLGEEINHLEIFERDGWICYVCNQLIDRRKRLPDLMAATLEHIIPLNDGGSHTKENTTCSHAACNFYRNGSLPKRYNYRQKPQEPITRPLEKECPPGGLSA